MGTAILAIGYLLYGLALIKLTFGKTIVGVSFMMMWGVILIVTGSFIRLPKDL